jgi:hypothetical protein
MNNPNAQNTLANATAFTSINAWVSSVSGDYSHPTGPVNTFGVGLLGGSVNFTDFTFLPPQAPPPMTLWTFVDAGITYSFTADTMTSHFDAASDQWTFGGTGYASITGFAPTEGSWLLSASESLTPGPSGPIVSFGFDSDAVAAGTPINVPDGGMTVAMLSGAFLGFSLLRKKLLV